MMVHAAPMPSPSDVGKTASRFGPPEYGAALAELRAYAQRATHCTSLLAAPLAAIGIASIRARLRCDEAAALRLLICERPCLHTWDQDVALVAAYAGVDRKPLEWLLREIAAADCTDWPRLFRRTALERRRYGRYRQARRA